MRARSLRAAAAVAAVGAAAVLGAGEFAHWRASRRRLGEANRATLAGGREAIVVLGFRNRGSRANFINRYRVRAGIRSLDPAARESVLVLCGGTAGGAVPEAELMARYAREIGFQGPLRLERESRSTRENVVNAIPLIEDADSIKVVSNSLHAEKGRAYLWRLRPDLGERLRRGADYRFGELLLVKPVAALVGLAKLRR
jgi:uncharacterized SAM-binding protein YcdF (DUF218 family)